MAVNSGIFSDPNAVIARAMRAMGQRPAPDRDALYRDYSADRDVYNRVWRPTPYEPREAEVERVAQDLGIDTDTARSLIREAARIEGGGIDITEHMQPNLQYANFIGLLQNHQQNLAPFVKTALTPLEREAPRNPPAPVTAPPPAEEENEEDAKAAEEAARAAAAERAAAEQAARDEQEARAAAASALFDDNPAAEETANAQAAASRVAADLTLAAQDEEQQAIEAAINRARVEPVAPPPPAQQYTPVRVPHTAIAELDRQQPVAPRAPVDVAPPVNVATVRQNNIADMIAEREAQRNAAVKAAINAPLEDMVFAVPRASFAIFDDPEAEAAARALQADIDFAKQEQEGMEAEEANARMAAIEESQAAAVAAQEIAEAMTQNEMGMGMRSGPTPGSFRAAEEEALGFTVPAPVEAVRSLEGPPGPTPARGAPAGLANLNDVQNVEEAAIPSPISLGRLAEAIAAQASLAMDDTPPSYQNEMETAAEAAQAQAARDIAAAMTQNEMGMGMRGVLGEPYGPPISQAPAPITGLPSPLTDFARNTGIGQSPMMDPKAIAALGILSEDDIDVTTTRGFTPSISAAMADNERGIATQAEVGARGQAMTLGDLVAAVEAARQNEMETAAAVQQDEDFSVPSEIGARLGQQAVRANLEAISKAMEENEKDIANPPPPEVPYQTLEEKVGRVISGLLGLNPQQRAAPQPESRLGQSARQGLVAPNTALPAREAISRAQRAIEASRTARSPAAAASREMQDYNPAPPVPQAPPFVSMPGINTTPRLGVNVPNPEARTEEESNNTLGKRSSLDNLPGIRALGRVLADLNPFGISPAQAETPRFQPQQPPREEPFRLPPMMPAPQLAPPQPFQTPDEIRRQYQLDRLRRQGPRNPDDVPLDEDFPLPPARGRPSPIPSPFPNPFTAPQPAPTPEPDRAPPAPAPQPAPGLTPTPGGSFRSAQEVGIDPKGPPSRSEPVQPAPNPTPAPALAPNTPVSTPSPTRGVASPDAERDAEKGGEEPGSTGRGVASPSPGAGIGVGNSPAGQAPSYGMSAKDAADLTAAMEENEKGVATPPNPNEENPPNVESIPSVLGPMTLQDLLSLSKETPKSLDISYARAKSLGDIAAEDAAAAEQAAAEQAEVEAAFSAAFAVPSAFGPMGSVQSGVPGISLGTAPAGLTSRSSSFNPEAGLFGGAALGQQALNASLADLAATFSAQPSTGSYGVQSEDTTEADPDGGMPGGRTAAQAMAEQAATLGSLGNEQDGPGTTDPSTGSTTGETSPGGGDGNTPGTETANYGEMGFGVFGGDGGQSNDTSGTGGGSGSVGGDISGAAASEASGSGSLGGAAASAAASSSGNPSDGAATSSGPFASGGRVKAPTQYQAIVERALRAARRSRAA